MRVRVLREAAEELRAVTNRSNGKDSVERSCAKFAVLVCESRSGHSHVEAKEAKSELEQSRDFRIEFCTSFVKARF